MPGLSGGGRGTRQRSLTARDTSVASRRGVDEGQPRADAGDIDGEAAELASKRLAQSELPALPNTSPHTLRRTYISIALLANRFDALWVMSHNRDTTIFRSATDDV